MENLYAVIFGLIGTGLMSLVLYGIREGGSPNTDYVRGIGSAIPTPVGGTLVPGIGVHIAAGALFGLLYLALGNALGELVPAALLALGVGIGILRGIVVSLVLMMLAFDQQPMEHVQLAGPLALASHIGGNVLFGLTVSVLFGVTRVAYSVAF